MGKSLIDAGEIDFIGFSRGKWSNTAVSVVARLLLFVLLPGCLFGAERSFWVWNRSKPLETNEIFKLHALGVRTLYWEVAELENTAGAWHRKTAPSFAPPPPSAFQVVPVVRLETSGPNPFADEISLRNLLSEVVPNAASIQIDYDCPDRLLDHYADALLKIRPQFPHLSITALAGWIDSDSFAKLQASVEEIMPMFYDLHADTASHLLPLADPGAMKGLIEKWKQRCQIPWVAGLPWFARLTLYASSGESSGHVPHWDWDDVCFNRSLATKSPTVLGMTVLQTEASTNLGPYLVPKGGEVVVRWPDLNALAAMEKMVSRVIYFRLPNDTPESGWSLSEVSRLGQKPVPQLELQKVGREGDTTYELVNSSDVDLPPRLSGTSSLDRGYALEVDAPFPVFRDVDAGDFWRVTGHQDPEVHPIPVALPLATRLTFWFSCLPAHKSLRIAQFQLAPDINPSIQLRYRVENVLEAQDWRQFP